MYGKIRTNPSPWHLEEVAVVVVETPSLEVRLDGRVEYVRGLVLSLSRVR
jgi:hypothetical protein